MSRADIESKYGKLLGKSNACRTTETHKRCSSCEEWLLHSEFYCGKVSKCNPYGLHPLCRGCSKKRRESDHHRNWKYKKRYGIDLATYNSMLEAQDRRCAICGSKEAGTSHKHRLHVDHDHETGEVRGLLCHQCNSALGMFQDNVATLAKAIQYLS